MPSIPNSFVSLARHWGLAVLLVTVFCGGMVVLITNVFVKPVYEAQTILVVTMPDNASQDSGFFAPVVGAPTFVSLVYSVPNVLQPVANAHNMKVEQLRSMVKAQPYADKPGVEVLVDNNDPALARQLSYEVTKSLVSVLNIYGVGSNLATLTIMQPAQSMVPILPDPAHDGLVGALAGFCFMLVMLAVYERRSRKRQRSDLE